MKLDRVDPPCGQPARWRYAVGRCRCPDCRQEHNEYMRVYLSNRRRGRRGL